MPPELIHLLEALGPVNDQFPSVHSVHLLVIQLVQHNPPILLEDGTEPFTRCALGSDQGGVLTR